MDDMPKRIEIFYKDARDNLMSIKQQQWRVTNYALTAYAALFAVAALVKANATEKFVVSLAIILIATFSVLVLLSFKDALEKFRKRIAWVYVNAFTSEERISLNIPEQKSFFNTEGFIWFLIAVSVFGAMFAILIVYLAAGT